MRARLLASLLLVGCAADYDLHREKDPPATPEDTAEPVLPGDPPDISVEPASLSFGGLPKDCAAAPQIVTVSNQGGSDLVVDAVAFDGAGLSAFAVDWDGAPFTLAPGEGRAFSVAFTPNATVDYTVELEFSSNDPDEALLEVPADGFGATDAIYEQSFIQEYYAEVDVLWVVDNSGSMSEEQGQVVANFQDFINEFIALGLDYHMAVVTTDMDDPTQQGRFRGPVVSESTPDPAGAFIAQIDQGSAGSGDERGFDAAKAALTEPLLSGDNAGFLRPDAALSVIVLSDENDFSAMSAGAFASWAESLKSDPEKVTFSAICGDRGWGCQEFDFFGNTLSASGGDKYIDATQLTGGLWASICTSDYSEILSFLSLTAAGMTVEFPLDFTPSNLGLMTVTVNGAAIPNDSQNGWTYATGNNSVFFHGDSIPGPGDGVTVAYPVAGECP